MSEYTRRNIAEAIEANLSGLTGLTFDRWDNVADIIRDALDSARYEAPSVDYSSDAWAIVAGADFAQVEPECDFSECDNAIACVELEANAILREAYSEDLDGVLYTIGSALADVFALDEKDFTGASRYQVSEIRQCSGARLGDISHSLEYDLRSVDSTGAESVCVWLEHRELYFKVHGMEFCATLDDADTDTGEDE